MAYYGALNERSRRRGNGRNRILCSIHVMACTVSSLGLERLGSAPNVYNLLLVNIFMKRLLHA